MTGFNRAAWEGTKPLVEPLEHRPVAPGDTVAAKTPVDADGQPTIRGTVTDVRVTPDGEQVVTVVVTTLRHGKYWANAHIVDAGDLDPGWHVQTSPHHRQPAGRAAAQIAVAVGTRRLTSGSWTADDLFLLGAAQRLGGLDREPT